MFRYFFIARKTNNNLIICETNAKISMNEAYVSIGRIFSIYSRQVTAMGFKPITT